MIKKGMNALLLLCILLVCNGKSGAMEKEGNNAPEKKVSVESDRLPIADPYVMLMVPVAQRKVKVSPVFLRTI